jgi:ribosomal protein S18 acetylase RimI-like enzyme
MAVIHSATSPHHIKEAKALVIDYAKALGVDLCFQDFDRELEYFPEPYAPPGGRLLVAIEIGHVVGIVALKRLDDKTCEMKRLYVAPAHRRQKLGRKLAEAAITEGRAMGYKTMRLDTLARMKEAGPLYQSLGFTEIPAYYQNPETDVIYMERAL